MKILVLTMTHNMLEMVNYFLHHYAQFATKIIVWDDRSTDGTPELLSRSQLAEVRPWTKSDGMNEDVFLQHWREEYPKARGEYDWVMVVDFDEFIVPLAGHFMADTLRRAQIDGYEVVRSCGFNLVGDKFPTWDGREIYTVNPQGVYAPVYSKPVVFRPEADISWVRGRHALENCNPKVTPEARVKLLHARYFGKEYTQYRNAKNYARLGEDKGAGWSCAPNFKGEGSPDWADAARFNSFNVMEAKPY